MKRCLDVLISLFVLLVAAPLLILIATVILFDSGSPVFFRQERVGRGFRPFRIVKFRTMRTNNDGPGVTVSGDRRVTRAGRSLRSAKLDELPQFWNVLIGDMSIVGPRPEMPEYVELYRDRYRSILRVRPGITDLASIRFRNEESLLGESEDPLREYRERILPMKLDLAERYIEEQSILGDLTIIARTAIATIWSGRS